MAVEDDDDDLELPSVTTEEPAQDRYTKKVNARVASADDDSGSTPASTEPPEEPTRSVVPQAMPKTAPKGAFSDDEARGKDGNYGSEQARPPQVQAFSDDDARGDNGDYMPTKKEPTTWYGSALRGAARSALPTLAGGVAGAVAGAAATPVAPGVGTVAAGVAGSVEGSILASAGQEKLADKLGLTDPHSTISKALGYLNPFNPEIEAQDIAEHPKSSFAGELAPMAATGKVALGAGAKVRALGAGIGAGIETGQEAYRGEPLDPLRITAAGAMQGAFPGIRGTKTLEGIVGESPAQAAIRAKQTPAALDQRVNQIAGPKQPPEAAAAAPTPNAPIQPQGGGPGAAARLQQQIRMAGGKTQIQQPEVQVSRDTSLGKQPIGENKSDVPKVGDKIPGRPGQTVGPDSMPDRLAQIEGRASQVLARGAVTPQTGRNVEEVGDPNAPMQRRIAEKPDGPRRSLLKTLAGNGANPNGTQGAPTTGQIPQDVAAALPKAKKAITPAQPGSQNAPNAQPNLTKQAPLKPPAAANQNIAADQTTNDNVLRGPRPPIQPSRPAPIPTVPARQSPGNQGNINPQALPRAPFRESAGDINAPQRPQPAQPAAAPGSFGRRQPGAPPPASADQTGLSQASEQGIQIPDKVRMALANARATQNTPTALGEAMQKAQTAKRGKDFEAAVAQRGEAAKQAAMPPVEEVTKPPANKENIGVAEPAKEPVARPVSPEQAVSPASENTQTAEQQVVNKEVAKTPDPVRTEVDSARAELDKPFEKPSGDLDIPAFLRATGPGDHPAPVTGENAPEKVSRFGKSAGEEVGKQFGSPEEMAENIKKAATEKRLGALKRNQATAEALEKEDAVARIAKREGYVKGPDNLYRPDPVLRAEALRSGKATDTSAIPTRESTLAAFFKHEGGSLNVDKVADDLKAGTAKLRSWIKGGMNGLLHPIQTAKNSPIVKFNEALRTYSMGEAAKTLGQPRSLRGFYASAILAHNAGAVAQMKSAAHNELVQLMDADQVAWKRDVTTREDKIFRDVYQTTDHDDPNNLGHFVKRLVDRGIAPDKAQRMAVRAPIFQALSDLTWVRENKLGSPAEYTPRYLQGLYDNSPKFNTWLESKVKQLGPNGFTKDKVFELIADAENAGFKTRFNSVPDMVSYRLGQSAEFQALKETMTHLEDIGAAVKEKSDNLPNDFRQWTQYADPSGVRWRVAPDVAPLFNNAIAQKGLWARNDKLGSAYRAGMGVKAIWLPIKFMASAYHILHIGYAGFSGHNARALNSIVQDKDVIQAMKDQGAAFNDIFALPLHRIPLVGSAIDKLTGGRFTKYGQVMQDYKLTPDELAKLPEDRQEMVEMMKWAGIAPFNNKEEYIGNSKDALAGALRNWQLYKLPYLLPKRALEKIQAPFFDYMIPMLKAHSFALDTAAVLKRYPDIANNTLDLRTALQAIGKQNDNRFGEMFYDALHWNPILKDVMNGASISLGWNLGIPIREAGGALRDIATRRSPLWQKIPVIGDQLHNPGNRQQQVIYQATNKGTYMLSYAMTSMLSNAAISYYLSGAVPDLWDMMFPRNGHTNADGTPGRLQTMSNLRDIPAFIAHYQETNSVLGSLARVLYDKSTLQPLISAISNADWSGNELRDTNRSFPVQVLQTVDSLLAENLAPAVWSGIQRGQDTPRDKALSFAGYQPAPQYANNDAMQNRVSYLYRQRQPTRPYAESGQGFFQTAYQKAHDYITGEDTRTDNEKKMDLRKQLNQAIIDKDATQISALSSQLRQIGMGKQAVRGLNNPAQKSNFMFSKLPVEHQEYLIQQMTPQQYNYYVMGLPKGKRRQELIKFHDSLGQ